MKEASGQEPSKSIKEIIYEIKRYFIKKKITGNLGRVVEEEDKLICYVKKKKCGIEISHSGYKIYHVRCKNNLKKYRELIEKYNLNKNIVYVLDGLCFNRNEILEIEGDKNCDIQIKNCKFEFKFKVNTSGNCSLKNVTIEPIAGPMIYIDAENIEMNNINIKPCDTFDVFGYDGFTLRLNAKDSIDLKNFKVKDEMAWSPTLKLTSKIIKICNSSLIAKIVQINSKDLQSKNSIVKADNFVRLEVEKFNELNVKSPIIEYNSKHIKGNNNLICLKPISKEIYNNRQALLLKLKDVVDELKEQNQRIVEKFDEKLNNQSVGKLYARTRKKENFR